MYTRRELICEANPFKWMAQKNVGDYTPKSLKPGPVKSQIGSGIKKGLGLAFNNPLTRAASELQKAAMPGAGKTRSQIARGFRNVFGPKDYLKYGKAGRYYYDRQVNADSSQSDESESGATYTKEKDAKAVKHYSNDKKPCKATVNGKTSSKFFIQDSNGKVLLVFYPYKKLTEVQGRHGYIDPNPEDKKDTGFMVWNAETDSFELFDQPLAETPFAKDPKLTAFTGFSPKNNKRSRRSK